MPIAVVTVFALLAADTYALSARGRDGTPTMPCVAPRTAKVHAVERPRHCLEFIHNEAFGIAELPFVKIRWSDWGSGRATAKGVSHYCAMGGCVNRHVRLAVFGLRERCGDHTYTQLRVDFSPSHGLPGRAFTTKLPICRARIE